MSWTVLEGQHGQCHLLLLSLLCVWLGKNPSDGWINCYILAWVIFIFSSFKLMLLIFTWRSILHSVDNLVSRFQIFWSHLTVGIVYTVVEGVAG